MEKKVGIITLNDNKNYGNRLQNYAVQEVLKKIRCNTYNIENYTYSNIRKYRFLRILKNYNFDKNYSHNDINKRKFLDFNARICYYPKLYNPRFNYKDLDYVIVGSDQVWNPEFGMDEATLLMNIQPEKRIAFSASFGVDEIPGDKIEWFSKELKKFKAISVREEAGADIVKKLIGIKPEVVVDPTLLLNQEEWSKVAKKPDLMPNKYILTYFLSPKSNNAKELLENENKGFEVFEIINEEGINSEAIGPSEFLYLFKNAELILTDSFHACVFSIIFNKPFIVYDRNWNKSSMNSRIETLLKKLDLQRKYYGSNLINDVWEHNYEKSYALLENEKVKAFKFLERSLGDRTNE